MRDLDYIDKLKTYYTTHLYSVVRSEQMQDQTYYEDSFIVPEVKQPHRVYRSGLGVRIVDAPAEQIVTSNPQAFIYAKNEKKSLDLSTLINETWVEILKRQNPNPFKESIKNPLLRGETFIRLTANPSWTMGNNPTGLPIVFSKPDPMVIYASPEEDENGIPCEVVVYYERQPADVINAYPGWINLLNRTGEPGSLVKWFEYWDRDTHYAEADGLDVLGGVKPNPYGFVPFIRRFSGFGRRSPDGDISKLIVSDIRRSRDLLHLECVERSNLASISGLFSHKDMLITSPAELDAQKFREMKLGEYTVNVIDNLPDGTKIELGLSKDMKGFEEPTLQHHRDIISELAQRHPFILAGFPYGSSGRQQDMTEVSAMRRYDSVVENAESMWATAFEKAIEICRKLNLEIPKIDLDLDFQCSVTLKAKDPLEDDRRITLGQRLWNGGNGSISLRKLHVDYQGMTIEESDREVARMLADKITIYNPDIAAVMGMVAAEESGMEGYLEKLKLRGANLEQAMSRMPTNTEQQRTQGEIQSVEGMEESVPRGARQPPSGYNRGQ